jgi:hypothetical protein
MVTLTVHSAGCASGSPKGAKAAVKARRSIGIMRAAWVFMETSGKGAVRTTRQPDPKVVNWQAGKTPLSSEALALRRICMHLHE